MGVARHGAEGESGLAMVMHLRLGRHLRKHMEIGTGEEGRASNENVILYRTDSGTEYGGIHPVLK